MRDIERRCAERVLGPVILPPEKPTFSPWVFDDSGTFMVCTDGQDGGAVPELKLFPAFDYPHEDGSTHWCVRHTLQGGDSVPIAEVIDGCGQDLLNGLVVDGHTLHAGDGDDMSHELEGWLAALFAMAPKMHKFLQERVTACDDLKVGVEAEKLLMELARLAKS
jgi:hypothetical protein